MSEQTLHQSVLLNEVVDALGPQNGGCYLDATFGNGGYSRAILDAASCTLLAIDRDPDAVARGEPMVSEYDGRFHLVEGCFSVMTALLQAQSRLVGKSSDQFYVRSARYDDTTLDVEAVLPSDDDASALMVEGPESWYLTPAQAYKTVGRTAHYKINLKDIPKQANPADTLLKFTVVSGNSGIEMSLKPVRH